jgi:hypothetical protein
VFFAALFMGSATIGAGFLALRSKGLLPPPPLAATGCIDAKFTELRSAPLTDRNLIAVGSSATWRNLDMAAFERRFPGTRAYNAATCYLHADQTAYLAEFLLERIPRVRTVVTVVAPRDFETCPPQDTAFFDADLAHAYLFRGVPGWVVRIAGFRPLHLVREARRIREERAGGGVRTHNDGYGSSILEHRQGWRPPLAIDHRCHAGLTRLEAAAAEAGARLAVVTFPVMPEWAATFDPDGAAVEEWDDSRFADPVHLLYPHHQPFTQFILDEMARRWPAAGPLAGRG